MRRLKVIGANQKQLIDVYEKHVRSLLELAVPAWQGSITQSERIEIGRVQKAAFHIARGEEYTSYAHALNHFNLDSLEQRRKNLCLKFARKAERHPKHQKWFKKHCVQVNTRQDHSKYCEVLARTERFKIPYQSSEQELMYINMGEQ